MALVVGGLLLLLYTYGVVGLIRLAQGVGVATFVAFVATMVESLTGAMLQGKKGMRWMTNEVVNFINTVNGPCWPCGPCGLRWPYRSSASFFTNFVKETFFFKKFLSIRSSQAPPTLMINRVVKVFTTSSSSSSSFKSNFQNHRY